MSKFIHSGDWHLGGNYPNKADVSADYLIAQINDLASPAFRPDGILFGGDLTDRALHVHSERLEPFYRLVKATSCPIVLLQGTISHEPIGTIKNIAALTERICVLENPFDEVTIGHAIIRGLPGLTKPQLATWAREIEPACDGFADPTDAIKTIIDAIANRWEEHFGPKILLGHFTVSGCLTPTGQTLMGSDLSVGLDDLAASGADAVLLNHIHAAQQWDKPVFASYSGPPYPTSWGELDVKSFSIFEFDDATGRMTSFQRIPFPHRPMQKLNVEFTGKQVDGEWEYTCDGMAPGYVTFQRGMEYKVCYSVPKEIAAQVDDMWVRVHFKQHGIELAAVERTIRSTDRQRIVDIGSKETTRDQYLAVCNAKGEEPRAGALTKCDEIEEKGWLWYD